MSWTFINFNLIEQWEFGYIKTHCAFLSSQVLGLSSIYESIPICLMLAFRTSCVLSHPSRPPHLPQPKRAGSAFATLESSDTPRGIRQNINGNIDHWAERLLSISLSTTMFRQLVAETYRSSARLIPQGVVLHLRGHLTNPRFNGKLLLAGILVGVPPLRAGVLSKMSVY